MSGVTSLGWQIQNQRHLHGLLLLGGFQDTCPELPSHRSHPRFPEIQELLSGVQVTPAEVSETLLRSEDIDVALRVLADFLREKKKQELQEGIDVAASIDENGHTMR
ncbi:hypothetical protein EJB05_12249, partial [Eragrostis curvula]